MRGEAACVYQRANKGKESGSYNGGALWECHCAMEAILPLIDVLLPCCWHSSTPPRHVFVSLANPLSMCLPCLFLFFFNIAEHNTELLFCFFMAKDEPFHGFHQCKQTDL